MAQKSDEPPVEDIRNALFVLWSLSPEESRPEVDRLLRSALKKLEDKK